MCRVFYVEGNNTELTRKITKSLFLASLSKGNNDGYALATKNGKTRTLKLNKLQKAINRLQAM